jgi:hypothetical protein
MGEVFADMPNANNIGRGQLGRGSKDRVHRFSSVQYKLHIRETLRDAVKVLN